MKRVLVIDNYDSFVHNLARYLRLAGVETEVVRNDAVAIEEIEQGAYDAIVLSPGPGQPSEAGCCLEVVRRFHETLPLLGVCLGHQAIVEALGGTIGLAAEPMHGHTSTVRHTGRGLFEGVPNPITACRYHSLIAKAETLPAVLEATAWTEPRIVMAVEHREQPVFGVQFHPEAILTESGQQIIDNFIRLVAGDKNPG